MIIVLTDYHQVVKELFVKNVGQNLVLNLKKYGKVQCGIKLGKGIFNMAKSCPYCESKDTTYQKSQARLGGNIPSMYYCNNCWNYFPRDE